MKFCGFLVLINRYGFHLVLLDLEEMNRRLSFGDLDLTHSVTLTLFSKRGMNFHCKFSMKVM